MTTPRCDAHGGGVRLGLAQRRGRQAVALPQEQRRRQASAGRPASAKRWTGLVVADQVQFQHSPGLRPTSDKKKLATADDRRGRPPLDDVAGRMPAAAAGEPAATSATTHGSCGCSCVAQAGDRCRSAAPRRASPAACGARPSTGMAKPMFCDADLHGGGDADHFAQDVEPRAAGTARIDAGVGLDQVAQRDAGQAAGLRVAAPRR